MEEGTPSRFVRSFFPSKEVLKDPFTIYLIGTKKTKDSVEMIPQYITTKYDEAILYMKYYCDEELTILQTYWYVDGNLFVPKEEKLFNEKKAPTLPSADIAAKMSEETKKLQLEKEIIKWKYLIYQQITNAIKYGKRDCIVVLPPPITSTKLIFFKKTIEEYVGDLGYKINSDYKKSKYFTSMYHISW